MSQTKVQGFTIIELMLAMGFVSALLLAITSTAIQIGKTYSKGLTMKSVTQSAQAVIDDVTRTIGATTDVDLSKKLILTLDPGVVDPIGGRLCTGRYSYIWNNGNVIAAGHISTQRNKYISTTAGEIRFVKIYDNMSSYCTPNASGAYPDIDSTQATELISTDLLAVHKLTITQAGSDDLTGQRLYYITMRIGTNEYAALDYSGTEPPTCLPPSNFNANYSFCSVQQFNFEARAGNKFKL